MEKAKIIYNGNVNLERVDFGSSGFNFFDESPTQKVITDMSKRIQEYKELVLNEALKIHVSEKIDPIKEFERMFPRIKCIQVVNDELWYWDNGKAEGQLIVTFHQGDMFKGITEEKDGRFMYNTGITYTIAPKP